MTLVIGQSSRAEHLRMAIDMARAVGKHPTAKDRDRAAAVKRVGQYQDEIAWLERRNR